MTLIGGTIGSLMSMQIYRHKIRKKSFIFKIVSRPEIAIQKRNRYYG
ncbi:DUF1294 domain-containing protein, partial [Empedobacter sp.]